MRTSLTTKQIEDIYDILEECCGAHKNGRDEFISYMKLDSNMYEYRFCGWLGFGGKLYSNSQGVYVDCYSVHKSPLAAFAIKMANERINTLLKMRNV